jgi:hypothetical protein
MDGAPEGSVPDVERWLQKAGRWFIAYSVMFTIDLLTYAFTGIRINVDSLFGLLVYAALVWVIAAVLPFWQPDRQWRSRKSPPPDERQPLNFEDWTRRKDADS